MTEQELDELFALGHETQRVEFKPAGPRTGPSLWRVVRAAMAMANLRDGGLIVVGSKDDGQTLTPAGLDSEQLASWKYDDLSQSFSDHADPSIQFDLETVSYRGMDIVLIHVEVFDEIPVLCKKQERGRDGVILRKGACYVRSRGKPESAEVSTQEDMRVLLDLATGKAMAKWVAVNIQSGLLVPAQLQVLPDSEEFDAQLSDGDL